MSFAYEIRSDADRQPTAGRAIALGVFDGLHIGHRAVLSAACGVMGDDGKFLTATALCMTGVPKRDAGLLLTPACQRRLLDTLGIDEHVELRFDEVRDMTPEQFVQDVLCDQLSARVVCCGEDYRFGKNGSGTAEDLRALCEARGVRVRVIASVLCDGEPISSTRVRAAITGGETEKAMRLLGRPFAVEIPVTDGDHRGRRWGIPTINQVFPEGYTVPRYGVYASVVVVDGRQYRAVTNVGVHPTVGGAVRPQAETWIRDFDGELYGQAVSVMLIRFLRAEQRFDTVDTLRRQIAADADRAAAVLDGTDGSKAVIFDFDDTLQDRKVAFLRVARTLLRLHMSAADEQARERYAQEMRRQNNGGYVDYSVFFHRLVEEWPFDEGVTGGRLFWEYLRLFPLCSQLFPETVEVLQTLRQRGYRIGILTNGNSMMQNRKLDATGLRLYTDLVMVAGDEGIQKPNPELFRRLAQRLCVAPENCVFVGDHPINDIQGAIDAGMQAIFLNTRRLSEHPDGVEECKRLRDILERL